MVDPHPPFWSRRTPTPPNSSLLSPGDPGNAWISQVNTTALNITLEDIPWNQTRAQIHPAVRVLGPWPQHLPSVTQPIQQQRGLSHRFLCLRAGQGDLRGRVDPGGGPLVRAPPPVVPWKQQRGLSHRGSCVLQDWYTSVTDGVEIGPASQPFHDRALAQRLTTAYHGQTAETDYMMGLVMDAMAANEAAAKNAWTLFTSDHGEMHLVSCATALLSLPFAAFLWCSLHVSICLSFADKASYVAVAGAPHRTEDVYVRGLRPRPDDRRRAARHSWCTSWGAGHNFRLPARHIPHLRGHRGRRRPR